MTREMTVRHTAFEAIGTRWNLQVKETLSSNDWLQLLERIHQRIQAFDKAYSRFRPDSLVTCMSRHAGEFELPADGYQLLNFYRRLYTATGGKVTPLIGQLLSDAGYDAHYSLQAKPLRRPPAWEDALSFTASILTLKQAVLLDFGAAGKGYLVDIIGAMLNEAGLRSYTINAGGDIMHRSKGKEALPVGLENPLDTTEAIGIAALRNQSLCASAGSKRAWGKYHHVIDPDRLKSPVNIIGTWVIANDTMTADGLATALFFTEAAKLHEHFDFSFAVLQKDMTLYRAKDFPLTVFEAKNA